MSKKQEYYKVVLVSRGKLISYTGSLLPPNLVTQYYVRRPVTAIVGGLLVFDSLDGAVECWGNYATRRIYRCTVRDEVELPTFRANFWRYETFEDIWENRVTKKDFDVNTWPPGTRAFRTVTLRERVK